jgi:hypothetical protein
MPQTSLLQIFDYCIKYCSSDRPRRGLVGRCRQHIGHFVLDLLKMNSHKNHRFEIGGSRRFFCISSMWVRKRLKKGSDKSAQRMAILLQVNWSKRDEGQLTTATSTMKEMEKRRGRSMGGGGDEYPRQSDRAPAATKSRQFPIILT